MTTVVQPTTATLTVTPITTVNGYTIINMGQTEVIQDSKTILHIINTNEIQQTVNILKEDLEELQIIKDPIIVKILETIQAKLDTLEPRRHNRAKRGLINIVGTAHKWLFGTMDDSDRQQITDQMKILEENVGNAIGNLNKQIEINSSLNKSITNLKTIIESDRNQISKAYGEITENEKRIIRHQIKNDQILKLRMLDEKLSQIMDNIALIKHGLVHPSMLTATELKDTKLDFYGLKNIRAGLLKYNQHTLIFAIKIPNTYELVTYKLLTAIPTEKKLEVVIEDQFILEINKTQYCYERKIQFVKELKLSNNCVIRKDCKTRENDMLEIKEIDESTIVLKNTKNLDVINYCDDRILKLNGHFLLTINNCSIEILNQTFGNKEINYSEKFFYPDNVTYNFTKELDFKDILLKNFVNLEPIKLLKFNKNVQYTAVSSIIIIWILVAAAILTLFRKSKKLEISIRERKDKVPGICEIQENFKTRKGEVTYPRGYVELFKI